MSQKGFSLVEMLIVLAVIASISVIGLGLAYSTKQSAGGGEKILSEFATRFAERRAEAMRLNAATAATSLEVYSSAPLLEMNFADLSKTGSLITNGVDTNRDSVDDATGDVITHLQITSGTAVWVYSYRTDKLSLPDGWMIASGKETLTASGISTIGNESAGQGIVAYKYGFTPSGKTYAFSGSSWTDSPSGAGSGTNEPSLQNAPYWALYFIHRSGSAGSGENFSADGAVALAVHPSGRIERFRWNGTAWEGFGSR